jgi:hypothetical protein
MSYAPYSNLQATADFATFQFNSPTLSGPGARQLRFVSQQGVSRQGVSQQGGGVYHVEFRNKPADKKDDPSWPESKDFYCVVLTALLIVEIYSERYPRRILRFTGDTTLKALVYGSILTRYHHLLKQVFTIETAAQPAGGNFFIQRKPVPFFSIHTIESTWNGSSRIFNNDFSIELDKSIRIGLTLPNT